MNKRGSSTKPLWLLFMAVIGLFVGIILFNAVSNVLDDTSYWKIFYARDLGLLMDTGITGRGSLELNYNFLSSKKPLGFRLIASANPRIEVYDYNPDVKEPLVTSFRFARDNNIPVIDNDLVTTFFKIYISREEVKVSLEPLSQKPCLGINTSANPEETRIFIESDVERNKNLIKAGLEIDNFIISSSAANADMVLVILDENSSILDFFYEKEPRKSEKLSCLIKNNIIESNPSAFSASRLQRLPEDSEWSETLNNADVGLLMIIKELDTSEANTDLLISITDGVVDYYG